MARKDWIEYRGYWITRTELTARWRIATEPDGYNTVAYEDGDMTLDEVKADIDFHLDRFTK